MWLRNEAIRAWRPRSKGLIVATGDGNGENAYISPAVPSPARIEADRIVFETHVGRFARGGVDQDLKGRRPLALPPR